MTSKFSRTYTQVPLLLLSVVRLCNSVEKFSTASDVKGIQLPYFNRWKRSVYVCFETVQLKRLCWIKFWHNPAARHRMCLRMCLLKHLVLKLTICWPVARVTGDHFHIFVAIFHWWPIRLHAIPRVLSSISCGSVNTLDDLSKV